MDNVKANQLAEQIARLLSERGHSAGVGEGASAFGDRLRAIEAKLGISPSPDGIAKLPRVDHPSQQQFLELLADQIVEDLTKEKPCPYEPAGKACDHCSMCNSRGF